MENDKKQSARHLYAQTDLNKTQIANMLGIHRHTLSIWIREGDWDRLRAAGDNLPSILAEKVYLMIGHLTDYHLSERRMTDPISHKEADTLYKLALTVAKLRTRSALNESMEMMGHLLQRIQKKDADLATRLAPHIDEYLSEKAHIHTEHLMPEGYTAPGGRIPVPTPQEEADHNKELHADREEAFYSDPETVALYQERGIPIPTQYNSLITEPPQTHSHTQTPHTHPPLPLSHQPGGAEHMHKPFRSRKNNKRNASLIVQKTPLSLAGDAAKVPESIFSTKVVQPCQLQMPMKHC